MVGDGHLISAPRNLSFDAWFEESDKKFTGSDYRQSARRRDIVNLGLWQRFGEPFPVLCIEPATTLSVAKPS